MRPGLADYGHGESAGWPRHRGLGCWAAVSRKVGTPQGNGAG